MVDIGTLGVVLVFLGLTLVMVSMVGSGRKGNSGVKGGGVVLIGPIPIVFGSDAKWAVIAIVLSILLILLVVALNLV